MHHRHRSDTPIAPGDAPASEPGSEPRALSCPERPIQSPRERWPGAREWDRFQRSIPWQMLLLKCCTQQRLQAWRFALRAIASPHADPGFRVPFPEETFTPSSVPASQGPAVPGIYPPVSKHTVMSPSDCSSWLFSHENRAAHSTVPAPRKSSTHLRPGAVRWEGSQETFGKSCSLNHRRFPYGFCLHEPFGSFLHVSIIGWNRSPHSEKAPSRPRTCVRC